MRDNSCLVRGFIIYFVLNFMGAIALAGVGFSYMVWTESYISDPMPFTFCLSLACTVLAAGLVVPLELLIIRKTSWAKFIFFSISLPAIVIAFMVAANAFVINLYLVMDTELGIYVTFPIMVLSIGICAVVTALVLALSLRILKKRRACRIILRRVFLPFICLTLGATAWAFVVEWLLDGVLGLEFVIHFVALSGAIFGVTLGGATCFAFKRVLLGFFSGLGVAIAFLTYLVYGCIMLLSIPAEFYWVLVVGFVGFYFLLGLVYCLARFKAIRKFIREGTKKYWLTDLQVD